MRNIKEKRAASRTIRGLNRPEHNISAILSFGLMGMADVQKELALMPILFTF